MVKIMRMRNGDVTEVFGKGGLFTASILDAVASGAVVQLGSCLAEVPLPSLNLTVAVPWIKGGKTEQVIQKLTELGVQRIVVFQARREVAKGDDSKVDRLRKVALEACKQCERTQLPELNSASSIADAIARTDGISRDGYLILHEREGSIGLVQAARLTGLDAGTGYFIASGPEGGWHPEELADITQTIHYVGMGKRILRAETAPIVAVSALLGLAGEL